MKTTDLISLEEQITAADAAVAAAQNRHRSRPRGTPRMGGGAGPMRIDPQARAALLDLGLEVDDAVIQREQLKKQRAEAVLAELTDAEAMAAEDAAVETAGRALADAEAAVAVARTAYQGARGMQKHRADRIKTQRLELARAEAALRSTRSLPEKEQAQRDELVAV
jgi:hypothetical protein